MSLPTGYFRLHSFWWRPVLRPGHLVLLFPGTALFDGDFSHPLLISPTHFPQPKEAGQTRPRVLPICSYKTWGFGGLQTLLHRQMVSICLAVWDSSPPPPSTHKHTHSLGAFSTLLDNGFIYADCQKRWSKRWKKYFSGAVISVCRHYYYLFFCFSCTPFLYFDCQKMALTC